mgnify:CR=1 FL=1
MKIEHKQILRNLRKQNGSIVTDATEKAIARHVRKETKPILAATRKLYKQIRREVDATLANGVSWEKCFA